MVKTTRNFERFEKKNGFFITIFDKELTLELKLLFNPFSLKTIIFQFSKTYGTPTFVTRLKVAPNMADPISVNGTIP